MPFKYMSCHIRGILPVHAPPSLAMLLAAALATNFTGALRNDGILPEINVHGQGQVGNSIGLDQQPSEVHMTSEVQEKLQTGQIDNLHFEKFLSSEAHKTFEVQERMQNKQVGISDSLQEWPSEAHMTSEIRTKLHKEPMEQLAETVEASSTFANGKVGARQIYVKRGKTVLCVMTKAAKLAHGLGVGKMLNSLAAKLGVHEAINLENFVDKNSEACLVQ